MSASTSNIITETMTIPEIVSQFPNTESVFHSHGIRIQGYTALEHENVGATARVHQINLETLLVELNTAALQ